MAAERPPRTGVLGPRPLLAAAAAAAVTIGACAREQPPPGTLPDVAVPRIISIRPAPDSVVADFGGQLRIRFDEPVTVPQDLPRRMFVSPMEEYRMETGFSEVRLAPLRGWRDSVVYCFEIPEGITDLLRNRMEEVTEFCFSTGIPIASTRVTGTVNEAVTGRPPAESRVIFQTAEDSTPYGALGDAEGTFTLRALPPGEYKVYGFVDQNRNFRLDPTLEPYDSASAVVRADSVVRMTFSLVPPDSTPPLLLRATVVDPFTVELEFDDPLLNPQPADPDVEVRDSLGAVIPPLAVGMGRASESDLPSPDTVTAIPDSIAAPDTTGANRDSAAAGPEPVAPADSIPAGPVGVSGDSAGAIQDSSALPPVLPTRFVSLRFGTALFPGTYRVRATGLVNLRRLTGGGDTTFVVEPPPEPDPAGLDSTVAPDDSLPPPDTLSALGRGGGRR